MTSFGTSPSPLVAVLVGTDHHPFDRLVDWVATLAAAGSTRWFVQHGTTALPAGVDGAPILSPDALQDLLVRADAVVCHGGPGLIMEARSLGHRPIVVARDPARGEHVDDHQQRFLAFLGPRGLVTPAGSLRELDEAVRTAVATDDRQLLAATAGAAASARFGDLVDLLLQRS
ncbi:glycosyltransferase [Nocardioides plantarum]|uniref:Glycosyltransferase n=1 Tax=Nocardioides plantarum TaxID=29299 RepID=A0ABV5KDN0_9ACTN|nr:glycosyltransferase [Nocardioides plantarum]